MEINGSVKIIQISEDSVEILGVLYYTEAYVVEMMKREYMRGLHAGEIIHRLEIIKDKKEK